MNLARLPTLLLAAVLWMVSLVLLLRTLIAAVVGGMAGVPLLGPMLSRPNWHDRAAPIAIVLLYAWVLTSLAVRARAVWRENAASDRLITLLGGNVDPQRLTGIGQQTRAGERGRLIAGGLRGRGDLHDLIPGAASLDAITLETSYGRLHVYAWILPVLGFIGTAIAMISAIGGFAAALGETRQIEVLISRLSQLVIPGLAAAFGATVLALSAALVTYLCTMALQLWDQEILEATDSACLEFLSRVSRTGPAAGGHDPAVAATLQHILNEVKTIGSAHDELRAAVATLSESAQKLNKAADVMNAAAHTLRESATLPYNVTITRGARP